MLGWGLACLLYCVTLANAASIANLIGVGEQLVLRHDVGDLTVYWSDVANAENLIEGPTRKAAELRFRNVLREVVSRITPIAFPFPFVVKSLESAGALVEEHREQLGSTLNRFSDAVQYELSATWSDEGDLATPVKGSEYFERRRKSEARIAAIDAKLKAVTSGIVREWRQRQDRRAHLWFALFARDDRDRFIAALRSAGPSEGVRLRLQGPLPPTEFVNTIVDVKQS